MNEVETRSLRRAALLLLAVSALRWGWQLRPPPPPPPAPAAEAALLEESRARADEEARRRRPLEEGERLDPNRATEEELDRLPGVGAATARALVAFRDSAGPFRRPEELARVPGIGPATVTRIRPHLAFPDPLPVERRRSDRERGAPPVSLNTADEETLVTLPGIGPALARRIVETRRKQAFLRVEDLLRVPGIGPATLERLRSLVTVLP